MKLMHLQIYIFMPMLCELYSPPVVAGALSTGVGTADWEQLLSVAIRGDQTLV